MCIRDRHKAVRFHHVVKTFDLSRPVCLWQLRMALGVSLVLTAGQVFGVERFMWMGFALSLIHIWPVDWEQRRRLYEKIRLDVVCSADGGPAGRLCPARGERGGRSGGTGDARAGVPV